MDESSTPSDPEEGDARQFDDSTKESIKKLTALVDDLKAVEEHEKNILNVDSEPPLFVPTPKRTKDGELYSSAAATQKDVKP